MSREWVKLHTGMLGHVGTMRLSDSGFRLWIVLLMMAGQTDDDGRAGTVEDVVFYLRWTEAKVRRALAEMNGRVALDGTTITVRDWNDWQPKTDPTNAKRQADHRARQADELEALRAAANVIDCDVTPLRNGAAPSLRHGVSNASTRAPEPVEPQETTEPVEVTPKGGTATAAPSTAQPHWAGGSALFNDIADAIVDWMDVNPDVLSGGTRKAVKQAAATLCRAGFTGDQVAAAAALWFEEAWPGGDKKLPMARRRPSAKQVLDWMSEVDYRVRPEVGA